MGSQSILHFFAFKPVNPPPIIIFSKSAPSPKVVTSQTLTDVRIEGDSESCQSDDINSSFLFGALLFGIFCMRKHFYWSYIYLMSQMIHVKSKNMELKCYFYYPQTFAFFMENLQLNYFKYSRQHIRVNLNKYL